MHKREKQESRLQNRSTSDNVLKALFFHNSLPEYRIGWFKALQNRCDIQYIITNPQVYQKKYGFSLTEEAPLKKCIFLSRGIRGYAEMIEMLKTSTNEFDFIELPPLDSLREVLIGWILIRYARKRLIKVGYFWEKWEAPLDKQPAKRRIKNAILRIVPKMIYRHSDVIFAGGSKAESYFVNNGINKDKIHVIPNCSDLPNCKYEDIRGKYGIPKDKKLVLYLGRVIPEKGLDYLIQAFKGLANVEDYYLLVVGDGPFLSQCKTIAKDANNIVFAGSVNPIMRKNYFEQCDIFVFPCTYRNGWVDVWGLTVGEAVLCHKPVIATKCVGSAFDLIVNDMNGYIIEPETIEELCKAIEKVNNMDLQQLNTIDERLNKKYNSNNLADCYLNIVKKCLDIC